MSMDPWKQNSAVNFASMFKYLQSGIKKVNADLKPFAETEAHFVDAKFYVEDDIPNEVLPVEIPSMESKQVEKKHVKFITRKDISSPKEGPKYRNDHFSESTSNSVKAKISTSSNSPPFLRYVPLSCCKDGQSPFAECLQSIEDMGRPLAKLMMEDVKSCHAFNFIHKSFALKATKWIHEVFAKFDKAWYSTK